MSDTFEKQFCLQGNLLSVYDGVDRIYLSADEIYRSVIEGEPAIEGLPPGRPKNLPDLSFSKYPAEIRCLLVSLGSAGEQGVGIRVEVVADQFRVDLPDFCEQVVDHVVIEKKWFPLLASNVEEVYSIISEYSSGIGSEIALSNYLALKRLADESDVVLDLTNQHEVKPGLSIVPPEDALSLFEGSLFEYQEAGFRWLSYICQQKVGGILADEMGLGKTVQVIAALANPDRGRYRPSLIIVPSTLLENWRREFLKFAPSVSVLVHEGSRRTGLPERLLEVDVVVSSYYTVVRDNSLFSMVDWKVVILDEAQAIKNPDTQRTRACKGLKRSVSIAMTGTPIENRLKDLWSLVDFCVPGYLGSETEFATRFGEGVSAGAEVEPYVRPIMLRRRVSEVAQDLPDRIDIPQIVTLSQDEGALYEGERRAVYEEYGQSASLVALTKLRMFCTHPLLLNEGTPSQESLLSFSKFKRLMELLEEIFANGEKVLVFTAYNRMSDWIVMGAKELFGVYTNGIDGRTKINERQDVLDEFSGWEGAALLSLNPKAAGAGLNITAANHVIHYTLEWNPAVEDQASARAHRRGQTRPVTVHRLIVAETVEEAINQRLERKRELADATVVGVSGNEEEIEDIIRALSVSPIRTM